MLNSNQTFFLLGHRGARAELLENSEQGFAYTQNLQINGKTLDGVEFDIQMAADGEFVVVHDETLARLANYQSWVADKTLNELTNIHQSDFTRYAQKHDERFLGKKIFLLKDFPSYLQHFRHIELEIKTHSKSNPQVLVDNLLKLLSTDLWQNLSLTMTSFDTDILYQIQNQQQFLPFKFSTGLLLEPKATLASQIAFLPTADKAGEQLIFQTFNRACSLGCSQVGIYYALITPKLVQIAKMYGLKITAWTVNDIKIAKRMINMGVDCVITDYPTEFLTQFS